VLLDRDITTADGIPGELAAPMPSPVSAAQESAALPESARA
jgi:hypothetical protein